MADGRNAVTLTVSSATPTVSKEAAALRRDFSPEVIGPRLRALLLNETLPA